MKGSTYDPNKLLELAIAVMAQDVEVDVEALIAEFDEDVYQEREQFGKVLRYVSVQEYRKRLNEVLNCNWSFIIVEQMKEDNPVKKFDKDEDEYVDGTPYLKVTGALIIPGLGIQMGIGVKPTYGSTEANDWKAAASDAFKKACSMFGLEVEYDDDHSIPSGGSGNYGNGEKAGESLSDDELSGLIDDLEYDDDELEEANEMEIGFGKHKGSTLEEIVEDDANYVKWLACNANEQETRDAASIVLASYLVENPKEKKKLFKLTESKGSKSTTKGGSKSTTSKDKASTRTASGSKAKSGEKETTKKESTRKTTTASSKQKGKKEEDEDEASNEVQELIDLIEEIFEEEDYDDVTSQGLIRSVSTNKKTPKGKTKLSSLTLKELEKLADVLAEEE